MFDSVFELMNKLPHLSDGDPDGDTRSSVGYAISRSSSDKLGFVNRYSGLEVLVREARVGIGFGSWREWGRHQLGVTYRSVHYNNRENSDILCSTEQPSASSGLWSGTKDSISILQSVSKFLDLQTLDDCFAVPHFLSIQYTKYENDRIQIRLFFLSALLIYISPM